MIDELQPGDPREIGPYRLTGVLGSGGMGRVFLGRSPGGRQVAVKVIRADLAADAEFRARFRREVTAARTISGLYTAALVDADLDGPAPWLATVYVDGPSLAEAVTGGGPLPPDSLRALAAGLAEALAAIHGAGLVHRDLKPSNILLSGDGPRVIDFGISRAADTTTLTYTGQYVGSPGFLSPEQAEGQEITSASDIFSLGAVLVFAATAGGPFGTGSLPALIYRVVHARPALDGVPDDIRPLIERCLAKAPGDRPAAGDLLASLAGLADGEPQAHRPPQAAADEAAPAAVVEAPTAVAGPDTAPTAADSVPGPDDLEHTITTARATAGDAAPASGGAPHSARGASPATAEAAAAAGGAGSATAGDPAGDGRLTASGDAPPGRDRRRSRLALTGAAVIVAVAAITGISLAATAGGPPSGPSAALSRSVPSTTRPAASPASSQSTEAKSGPDIESIAKAKPKAGPEPNTRLSTATATAAPQPSAAGTPEQPPPDPATSPAAPQEPAPSPTPPAPSPTRTTPAPAPPPAFSFTWSGATSEGCPAGLESSSSADEVRFSFANESQYTIELYWISQTGVFELYATMPPGDTTPWDTYVGHYWLIANTAGECQDIFGIDSGGQVTVS